jgi:hypothetical protein
MKLLIVTLCGVMLAGRLTGETVTITGWFSDEGCGKSRLTAPVISPNGPDCVKKCLDQGAQAVFLSEQGKEMLKVAGYDKVKEDVGYHMEITGIRDAASKTITVQSAMRISEYQGASCQRPKKKS